MCKQILQKSVDINYNSIRLFLMGEKLPKWNGKDGKIKFQICHMTQETLRWDCHKSLQPRVSL